MAGGEPQAASPPPGSASPGSAPPGSAPPGSAEDGGAPQAAGPAEHRASWAELFFDLVAVAGVAAFAHVLHAPSPHAWAVFVLGFGALWMCWTSFMVYGNTAGTTTRTVRLVIGMTMIAAMVASVDGLAENLGAGSGETHADAHNIHATVFAIAYLGARFFAAQSWNRGEVVTDWPVAQQAVGALPWLASIWAPPSWTLWLWGAGLTIDVLILVLVQRSDMVERFNERIREHERRAQAGRGRPARLRRLGQDTAHRGPRGGRQRRGERPLTVVGRALDPEHLDERMSLFVIIVLGESILQVIEAAAQAEWTAALLLAGAAAITVAACLFGLSVVLGGAGVPLLRLSGLALRAALGFHSLTTACLVIIAVGLGGAVESAAEAPGGTVRWLLWGGLAGYFLIGALASLITLPGSWPRALMWLLTGTLLPVLCAIFVTRLPGAAMLWLTVLIVGFHLAGGARPGPQPTAPENAG